MKTGGETQGPACSPHTVGEQKGRGLTQMPKAGTSDQVMTRRSERHSETPDSHNTKPTTQSQGTGKRWTQGCLGPQFCSLFTVQSPEASSKHVTPTLQPA